MLSSTAIEEEVKTLKSRKESSAIVTDTEELDFQLNYGRKDTTKYLLDGRRYGKNRLALAIVKKYVAQHPEITSKQLMSIFDKSIQGSLGVVRTIEDAMQACADSERRFFMKKEDIIYTANGACVVCTQWGIFNIDFLHI